jgi:hypothetical protein
MSLFILILEWLCNSADPGRRVGLGRSTWSVKRSTKIRIPADEGR